jgi:hypothetical protein
MAFKEEPVGEETWFSEAQQRVMERYQRNKAARSGLSVSSLPDFRTIDQVVDYYAEVEAKQGPGAEESVEVDEDEESDENEDTDEDEQEEDEAPAEAEKSAEKS